MNQDKFGKFIKDIRKRNNLTQKEFANKYNVTYQAVSKWENGINMPDSTLIRKISEDFNVSLEELFDGEYKNKKENKKILIIFSTFLIFIFVILLMFIFISKDDFTFKTLSSKCNEFNISGNISYNDKKSAIYITNIEYCGNDKNERYSEIECTLYEADKDIEKKISSYKYTEKESITIDEFLKKVTFIVDDYDRNCKEYKNNSLYLSINAKDSKNKITTYKIPLSLEENCNNN